VQEIEALVGIDLDPTAHAIASKRLREIIQIREHGSGSSSSSADSSSISISSSSSSSVSALHAEDMQGNGAADAAAAGAVAGGGVGGEVRATAAVADRSGQDRHVIPELHFLRGNYR
jgi:hypothetical protein